MVRRVCVTVQFQEPFGRDGAARALPVRAGQWLGVAVFALIGWLLRIGWRWKGRGGCVSRVSGCASLSTLPFVADQSGRRPNR